MDWELEEAALQKMLSYCKAAEDRVFWLCVQPVCFELIDNHVFAEILEQEVLYCHIAHLLRERVSSRKRRCGCAKTAGDPLP
jgi:hypothetical protein